MSKVQFQSNEHWADHCCKHVLTPPESSAWHLVFAETFPELAASHARDQELEANRRRLEEQPETVQRNKIARAYLTAGLECVDAARATHWFAETTSSVVHMDTRGVFAVVSLHHRDSTTFRTIFVPQHSPSTQVASYSALRDRGVRKFNKHSGVQETATQQRRVASRTREERLFHDVFWPALRKIRRAQESSDPHVQSRFALKQKLPSASAIKLGAWQDLHRRCRYSLPKTKPRDGDD